VLHDCFDPFFLLVQVCAVSSALCWLLSVVTREYSWVDRLWSLAPVAYCWLVAAQAHFVDGRLNLVTALVTAWGARLTFNFARKGGYKKGGEDYRWAVLRERLGPVGFQVFNFTFIAPFQNALLLMIVAPAVVVAQHPGALGVFDGLLAAAFVLLLIGETVADEQQWRFQQAKVARKARGEAGPEFCTTGLFRFSRHPNFFCEVSLWWCIYGFAVVAGGAWVSWAGWGAVTLTGLFQGSTAMTEGLSKAKYPAYADYQRSTSRLVPWLPGRS
jgi:steroid 5-alpha reductase family enzyme